MALLICLSIIISKSIKIIPSPIQSMTEIVIQGLYDFFESVMGHTIKKAFPVLASLFLFIIVANWMGLLPGFGTIGFYEEETTVSTRINSESTEASSLDVTSGVNISTADSHPSTVSKTNQKKVSTTTETNKSSSEDKRRFIPIFRGATADLNTTIALAIISFFSIQYFGFASLGIEYSKRFLNFSNPIMFFVGLLEIISDLSKVISFAFRLFGNIFAGEVLLAVMAFLMPFIAPMPFLLLELFVGFIQALVFSTLTAVFINVAVAHEG